MLFNSFEYFIFIFIFFITYWFVVNRDLKLQNLLILFSSYIFYGWWDYRFLSLIFLSTIVDYFIGINILGSFNPKKHNLKNTDYYDGMHLTPDGIKKLLNLNKHY